MSAMALNDLSTTERPDIASRLEDKLDFGLDLYRDILEAP